MNGATTASLFIFQWPLGMLVKTNRHLSALSLKLESKSFVSSEVLGSLTWNCLFSPKHCITCHCMCLQLATEQKTSKRDEHDNIPKAESLDFSLSTCCNVPLLSIPWILTRSITLVSSFYKRKVCQPYSIVSSNFLVDHFLWSIMLKWFNLRR